MIHHMMYLVAADGRETYLGHLPTIAAATAYASAQCEARESAAWYVRSVPQISEA